MTDCSKLRHFYLSDSFSAYNKGKLITYDVAEAEQLAEVVAIAPPVVVSQVLPEIVQQELLLLLLLHL